MTQEYKTAFRAAFDFMARWQPFPSNPEAWADAARDLGNAADECGNNPFMNDLLLAVYSELERNYKKG